MSAFEKWARTLTREQKKEFGLLIRAEQLRPMFAELAGMSHRKIAAELNARKIPMPAGGQWHAVTVKRVLSRLA
jgi:hypothetical protein